jgi:hypothetical protein
MYNDQGEKIEVVEMRKTKSYTLPVPGLVATRPIKTPPGQHLEETKRGWCVTHQKTGLVLSHIRMRTLDEAASIACDLADLGVDWTLEELSEIRESFSNDAASHKYQDANWNGMELRDVVLGIFENPPGGAHTMGIVRS